MMNSGVGKVHPLFQKNVIPGRLRILLRGVDLTVNKKNVTLCYREDDPQGVLHMFYTCIVWHRVR